MGEKVKLSQMTMLLDVLLGASCAFLKKLLKLHVPPNIFATGDEDSTFHL